MEVAVRVEEPHGGGSARRSLGGHGRGGGGAESARAPPAPIAASPARIAVGARASPAPICIAISGTLCLCSTVSAGIDRRRGGPPWLRVAAPRHHHRACRCSSPGQATASPCFAGSGRRARRPGRRRRLCGRRRASRAGCAGRRLRRRARRPGRRAQGPRAGRCFSRRYAGCRARRAGPRRRGPSSSAPAGGHARRCCSPVRAVLDTARST